MGKRRLEAGCRAIAAFLMAVALFLPGVAAASDPKTYAMFVGVADYEYGSEKSRLKDLGGAPADIQAIKSTLLPRMDVAKSVTLLDSEATRAAIINTFNNLVSQASPGDFVFFYFSGHGRRVVDMSGEQISGKSSTIVPYDGKASSRQETGATDIIDNEMRRLVDAANAAGINVLTIFDSCNSGTATRFPVIGEVGVRKRFAPPIEISRSDLPELELPRAVTTRSAGPVRPGYAVHLAAAPDGDATYERVVNGTWRGDFTAAIVEALNELPTNGTYRDLLSRTKANLTGAFLSSSDGRTMMTDIRGEGALDQSVLGRWNAISLLEGRRDDDGTWSLKAGKIAGVTVGSRYGGFESGGDALDENAVPLTTAYVSATASDVSELKLEGATPQDLPKKLMWREISRGAGEDPTTVGIHPVDDERAARIADQLATIGFVERTQANPDIALDLSQPGKLRVARVEDNSTVTTLGDDDPNALREALRKVSSYRRLQGLVGTGAKLNVEYFALSAKSCKEMGADRVEAISEVSVDSDTVYFLAKHREKKPLIAYLINLTENYEVSLVTDYGTNAAQYEMKPGKCWNWPVKFSAAGRDHMLLVLSETPLPGLSRLNQEGFVGNTRSINTNPLSDLIEDAARGVRSGVVRAPGVWAVQEVSYQILPTQEEEGPDTTFRSGTEEEQQAPDDKAEAEGTQNSRIANGEEAPEGYLPWQVSLFRVTNGHFCGGTTFGKEWIITAAHCLKADDLERPNFFVLHDTVSLSEGGTVYNVEKVIAHEGFSRVTKENDIALLKLARPIPGAVSPALDQFEEGGEVRPIFGEVTVSGFGRLDEADKTGSEVLMMADIPVIPNDICNGNDVYGGQITDSMLCAGQLAPDSLGGIIDACRGDSGGPLIENAGTDSPVLVGVVSWGRGCARPNRPGVYTRIASHYDWLMTKIAEVETASAALSD